MAKKLNSVIRNPEMEGRWQTLDWGKLGLGLPRAINHRDDMFLVTDSYLHYLFSHIVGQMLTIADAITDDEKKREALKSLIQQALWNEAKEVSLLKLEKIK